MPAENMFAEYLDYLIVVPGPSGVLTTRTKAWNRQLEIMRGWYSSTGSLTQTRLICEHELKIVKDELHGFSNDDFDFDYLTGQQDALEHALAWINCTAK